MLVVGENEPTAAPEHSPAANEPGPRRPVASQSALVREAMEHPFVVHARQVFDAAIRKVEPPRQTPVPASRAANGSDDADGEPVVHAEEGDG